MSFCAFQNDRSTIKQNVQSGYDCTDGHHVPFKQADAYPQRGRSTWDGLRYAGDMSSPEENALLARAWLDAFNAHDVDALVALYDEDATHSSPKIRGMYPETGGLLQGKAELAKWWRDANERQPGLRYVVTSVVADRERVIIEYIRHAPLDEPTPVAEAFDVRDGKIVASRVYHG